MARRSFYEDDEEVTPVPGLVAQPPTKKEYRETNTPIPAPPAPNTTILEGMTIRTSPVLEKYAHDLRLWTIHKLDLLNAETENLRSATKNEIQNLKDGYKDIVVEPLLPQTIQILTAALTGSILVNRRSLPLRFITPLVFGLATFKYTMPKTSDNLFRSVRQYEQEYLPQVDEIHTQTENNIKETVKSGEKLIDDANATLLETVSTSRKSFISWLTK